MCLSIYVLATLVQLHASNTLAALPHVKCTRTYHKLGCYKAVSDPSTPWQLLITDRINRPDRHVLDWNKWEESIHSLACRCAKVARRENFTVFGLQNYAECWSGPNAEKTFNNNGHSNVCLMILRNPPACDMNDPRECMGAPGVNFMYMLDVDHCRKDPCKNGAKCIAVKPSGYKCDCMQGFTGSHCETDVDECRKMPCKNRGNCFNKPGSFECTCLKGYQGKLCDQDEDECVASPCKNGGLCVNTVGSFRCKCPQQFQGKLCEQDVDECSGGQGPCHNGATCLNTVSGFRCKCPAGFNGKLCKLDVDECVTARCQNKGTCLNTVGSYKCQCQPGFTGTFCENKDVCSKNGIYDLGLIIDGSHSVGVGGFASTKSALLPLINQFQVSAKAVHFGIIAYGGKAKLVCPFSNMWCYRSPMYVQFMIMGMEFQNGYRRTDEALRMAGKDLYSSSGGQRTGVPNVLVVITNGKTAQGSQPYSEVLQPLKEDGVNVIAVGVGNEVTEEELTNIAMGKQERIIHVHKIENLHPAVLRNMIEDIC